tara:strand:- start:175 stop:912 length:738 start_codon:yes stop_codon:yes gene_type:complete
MKNRYKLFEDGFEIRKLGSKNLIEIKKIKKIITKNISNNLKFKGKLKLEKLHQVNINNFNQFRLDAIKNINQIKNIKRKLFETLKDDLLNLFGEDIVIQKYLNLAIQRPNDQERTPMHSDAPSHSLYEVVVWLPLVDCKKTMGMYYFPINKTEKAKRLVINGSQKDIEKFSLKEGVIPNVKFGEFVIFWTKCFHYIPINLENNTRWSLNFRFKNTFTPYSKKGFLDYYEPVNYSKITEMVLNEEK